MPALVAWVFSRIPDERQVTIADPQGELTVNAVAEEDTPDDNSEVTDEKEPVDPHNRWLTVGLRLGGSVRFYALPQKSSYISNYTTGLSFEAALQLGFRFLPFLSVQGEVVYSTDRASFRVTSIDSANQDFTMFISDTDSFNSSALMLPVVLKFHLRKRPFLISPFAGVYWTIPLGQMTYETTRNDDNPPYDFSYEPDLGIVGGVDIGFPAGPGVVFLDLRYALDFGDTFIQMPEEVSYKRSMFSLSLGYEFSFFNKKRRAKTP
jgi:hypothetical protein